MKIYKRETFRTLMNDFRETQIFTRKLFLIDIILVVGEIHTYVFSNSRDVVTVRDLLLFSLFFGVMLE